MAHSDLEGVTRIFFRWITWQELVVRKYFATRESEKNTPDQIEIFPGEEGANGNRLQEFLRMYLFSYFNLHIIRY